MISNSITKNPSFYNHPQYEKVMKYLNKLPDWKKAFNSFTPPEGAHIPSVR